MDNKGRAIRQGEQVSGNLYDELSRVAEYESSRSVLDGYSKQHRNQHNNLNRTMQVKKKSTHGGSHHPDVINRKAACKSVLTNGDRDTSPTPSQGNGPRITKMNIKKNQIRLVGNGKRNSVAGGSSNND